MNDAPARTSFPLPERVCEYGSRDAFDRARPQAGQWVFWEDRVEAILDGRYDDVKPLHVEVSPTYLCNFACPWCSCRAAREDWADEDVFNHPRASPSTVIDAGKLDRILEHLATDRIGIQWVGGEPTMHPLLYQAAVSADRLGLKQCLFTNGSLLDPKRVARLFESHFVFVRVSLNAVTREIHQRHHDYRVDRNYHGRVMDTLRLLAKERASQDVGTMVSVSVVVDERNIDDVEPLADHLVGLCDEFGAGAIDYVIIRPAYPFYTARLQMSDDTALRLWNLVRPGAPLRARLEDAGLEVVAPESSFIASEGPDVRELGEACLSCGWFGEITPNGDMVICSDRYGNPEYFIGNAAEQSIDALWTGERRRQVLSDAHRISCFKTQCPRNGRGFHLNRIFHTIEAFRREGRLHEVRRWIADLRAVLPRPEHSFFL